MTKDNKKWPGTLVEERPGTPTDHDPSTPVEPDAAAAADLAWLGPTATMAVISEPDGSAMAYTRPPGGRWSPLPVRAALCEVPKRPDRFHQALCSGWCSNCGCASTWRADASPKHATVTIWQCVRCPPGGANPPKKTLQDLRAENELEPPAEDHHHV
jgi:hypothetical protein